MMLPLLLTNGYHLLLFSGICYVASGHFVPSATDYHHHQQQQYHHHHHQYQQEQQKQYHLSPTRPVFIPAVPRSHLLPHQHIIIRRASPPQQQYSLATSPHPVAPAFSAAKKFDRFQIEEELKALKKKRKRLRQLREEVRELSNHLQSKRIFLKDDSSDGDVLKKHKGREAHVRWRKQITTRMKAIMKRLKRLENEVKNERNYTKDKKKITGRLPMLPVSIHTKNTTPAPPTLLTATTKNFKIKRLHSSINQSKNGESGGICSGHKDCQPGLCCHRISLAVGTNSSLSAATSSVCHQYLLKEGEACEDSCQCEARLHCFRSSSNSKTGNFAAKSRHDAHAICKKVSTEDIVRGVYLNSKDSSFLIKPSGLRL